YTHTEGDHTMVLADHPHAHADVPGPRDLLYDPNRGGHRHEGRIHDWEKAQQMRSGRVTLWDHCFEVPHQNLEGVARIQDSVAIGEVSHSLTAGGAARLEAYDYPGAYAQRFDGVEPTGADRQEDVQQVFTDNTRTARIRMEAEAARALEVVGRSDCVH